VHRLGVNWKYVAVVLEELLDELPSFGWTEASELEKTWSQSGGGALRVAALDVDSVKKLTQLIRIQEMNKQMTHNVSQDGGVLEIKAQSLPDVLRTGNNLCRRDEI
jgi:hypothetical protein